MTEHKQNIPLGMALGLLGVTLFGGTVPATRLAVAELDPWFITFGRAAIAGVIALIILAVARRRLPVSLWRRSFLASLCLVIGFPGFLGIALETVPAAHTGVVLGLLPVTTSALSALLTTERPSMTFWIWSIIGATLVLVFAFQDGVPGFQLGDLWLAGATLSASLGYVISGGISRQKPGWEVICWQLVIASPIIALGTFWFYDAGVLTASSAALSGFLYVSFISMLVGFFAWNAGLALGGIARVSQTQLLQTFVTLAIAAVILDEAITIETLGFALAIMIVIFLAQRSKINTKAT